MNVDKNVLAERLRVAREARNITQSEAASMLGKPNQSYISKLENGEKNLDAIELKKISEIYKKPISFFLKD